MLWIHMSPFFFFNDTATTEIYTLSLHDALPIWDANLAGEMYPDQSLYPADSVPAVVRRINNTLRRADEIHHAEGGDSIDWLQPVAAGSGARLGRRLNPLALMEHVDDAGAARVHLEH